MQPCCSHNCCIRDGVQDIIAMPEFMPVDENGRTEMLAAMVQGVLSVLAIIRQDNETEEVRQVMEVRLT